MDLFTPLLATVRPVETKAPQGVQDAHIVVSLFRTLVSSDV